MFKGKIMKWNRFLVALAFGSTFLACSDKTAGTSEESEGLYAVKDLDVAGVSQKGPFIKGSAVTVRGIDCKTMKLTDERFEGSVKSDKGDFDIANVNLTASCALFEVTGKYLNEFTGKKSTDEITLHALTDLKDRKNVNINLLTQLEYERVMNLFAEAKKRAEKEVLAAFGVKSEVADFESLNIFEKGDGNSALLAVSVLMQSDLNVTKLAERMNGFAADIAETGTWNDKNTKTEIAEWAATAKADGEFANVRKNIKNWGYTDEIPAFESVVENFEYNVSKDTLDSSANSPLSVPSSASSNDVPYSAPCYNECMDWSIPKEDYLNPDIKYGEMTDSRDGQVYKTVKIGNQVWMAQNLNYFTPDMSYRASCHGGDSLHCGVAGRLYTWAVAMDSIKSAKDGYACGDGKMCPFTENYQGICPDGWRLPTEKEWNTLLTTVGGKEVAGKVLKSRVGWNNNGNGTDEFGFSALPAGDEFDGTGSYRNDGLGTSFWSVTEYYSVGAQTLYLQYNDVVKVSYDLKVRSLSIRCIENTEILSSSSSGAVRSSSSFSYEKTWKYLNPAIDYDEMIDDRDGQIYKTIKIGEQVWMAENLNYANSELTPSILNRNWCYDSMEENCYYGGRLYTWAAAIDSVKLATDKNNPQDCGYERDCTLPSKVQGICPNGWHLPDTTEWLALFDAVGGIDSAGVILKSLTGWSADENSENGNGLDAVGFSALPTGGRNALGYYSASHTNACFWSASQDDDSRMAYGVGMGYADVRAGMDYAYKSYSFMIRCLKD